MDAYVQCVSNEHKSFEIDPAGLYINPLAPHLGASPDGLISYDCRGLRIFEIKCPFSKKDSYTINNEAGNSLLTSSTLYDGSSFLTGECGG